MDDQQLDGRCEISVHSELTYYVDHAEYLKYDSPPLPGNVVSAGSGGSNYVYAICKGGAR